MKRETKFFIAAVLGLVIAFIIASNTSRVQTDLSTTQYILSEDTLKTVIVVKDTMLVSFLYVNDKEYVKYGEGIRIRKGYDKLVGYTDVFYFMKNEVGEFDMLGPGTVIQILREDKLPKPPATE